jgi:hypothetical protein
MPPVLRPIDDTEDEYERSLVRSWALDRFLIREVPEALMLSCLRDYLRLAVHVRPLVSVPVSGDRHSVSYSPLGTARRGHQDPTFRSVDPCTGIRVRSDQSVTSAAFRVGCPLKSAGPGSRSSVWLSGWLPAGADLGKLIGHSLPGQASPADQPDHVPWQCP